MMKTIILWSCLLAIQSDCLKINLALKKRAYLSSLFLESYARYAVDGNVDRNSYAHANDQDGGWFVVDLGRPYQVEYIVFYQRSECPNCNNRMDNFLVGLSNNFDPQINKTLKRDYKLCAQHNGPLVPNATIKLQCQDKEVYSRYLIIQQDIKKNYLTIPEIEVMGEYINYVGCFKKLLNNKSIESNVSLGECLNICENKNYMFAAFQKIKCICGNETKHFSPLSECNVTCPGGVDYCGSSNKLSVYEVFPLKFLRGLKNKYIGCFVDQNNADLTTVSNDNSGMTLNKCQNGCAGKNYLFFGVQSGNQCSCGNHYGKFGNAKNSCNNICLGNQAQVCGGTSANSIYSVYPEEGGSNFFQNNHHCKDGADLDLNGTCENKQCESGWTGEDCTMRDCSVNNGDCGKHTCQVFNGNTGAFSECICREGFDKNFWCDYCQDINECKDGSHECNTALSTCNNTEGSYECKCNNGYVKYDAFKCTDIDECSNDNQCNASTTHCKNIPGSYNCTCREGFTPQSPYDCRDIDECLEIPNACDLTTTTCINTFGSYECQCVEEGSVNDNKKRTCSKNVSDPKTKTIIISVVCTILLMVILLGVILFIKCRKKLPERITIGKKLQRNNGIMTYPTIEIQSEAVSLVELKEFYEQNTSRLLSDFETFPKVTDTSTSYGKSVKLKHKNKYRNIIPFDYNRVVLEKLPNENFSDYINASFIPSFHKIFRFIAAQGPIKETEYDFWRMVLEYKVEIIVMLTNCVENGKIKCFQYWSDSNSKIFEDIKVTLKDIKVWSTHEIRRFLITMGDIALEVTHMLYKDWLDNKIPENVGSIINFHHMMNSLKKQDSTSPIVVHCSAGVGRTGTFLAMDRLLHEAQQTGMVDVFKCLKFLRSHRNYMIQTKIQFMFCFDALNFYHDLGGTTSIKISNDLNIQHLLLKRIDAVEKEYEWISRNISSNKQDHGINKSKKFIFPGCVRNSTYKMHIESETSWQNVVECCADENNAITILVDELIDKKLSEFPFSSKNGHLILTEKFSHLQIKHIEMTVPDVLNHVYANSNKTDRVNIFAVSSNTFEQLRDLWQAVKHLHDHQKTLIVYTDDLYRAGFVVCALNLLEMMDAVEEIDVFQVVYQLKSLIPHFMEDIDQYRSVYMFAENYFKSNEKSYANCP